MHPKVRLLISFHIFLIKTETKIKSDNTSLFLKQIAFNNRVDGNREYFGLTYLFSFGNGNFLAYWNINNNHITHNNMFENGLNY